MSGPILDPTYYYRLTNDRYGLEKAMSCYSPSGPPRDVKVSSTGKFQEQNWQFFYQDRVYFIRNYAYNTTYHLGVDRYPSNSANIVPVMVRATNGLNQQWFVDRWSDGTYRLTNKMLQVNGMSNSTYAGVGDYFYDLAMLSTEIGSKWTIKINPDMGRATDKMLQRYDNIEVESGASGTVPTASPTSTPGVAWYEQGGGMIPLQKAGIGIGVAALFIMLVALFFYRRRNKQRGLVGTHTRSAAAPQQPQHGRAEVIQEPPPAYQSRHVNSFASQSSTLNAGISGHFGGKKKAADEESIELPAYGRPSVEAKHFV